MPYQMPYVQDEEHRQAIADYVMNLETLRLSMKQVLVQSLAGASIGHTHNLMAIVLQRAIDLRVEELKALNGG